MTIYISIFEREQFAKLYENKYQCLLAGFSGVVATLSWFYAFTLIQSSFVRALGQVELIFSYLSSVYFFKEKIKPIEILGILIFILGIIVILFFK